MTEQTSVVRDVVVVGGGAAGLSAALTLARARRAVTVVDAGEPRNASAHGVHGLLALDGVKPVELLARGRDEVLGYAQLDALGVPVVAGRVSRLETDNGRVSGVRLDDGQIVAVDAVVVSTRMVARTAPFAGIGIKRAHHPAGEFIESDALDKTAVPGVWAAGNASDLSPQVSGAAAEGARAAGHINADLVMEDLNRAVAARADAATNEEGPR